MLRVKTYLDKSSIINAGIGLYAKEFISKDTIIWEWIPTIDVVYTKHQIEQMQPLDQEFIYKYSFIFKEQYYLCVDNSRFFNHSDEPNCYSTDYNEKYLGYTRAKRDINVGEELTDDYKTFGFTIEDRIMNTPEWSSEK